MQHKSTPLRNGLTAAMVVVTILLWGYIIGTFLAERQQLTQAFLPVVGGVFPGAMTPQAVELYRQRFEKRQSQMQELQARDQEPTEASLFAPEYRRFAERNEGFQKRLKQDRQFLLENSF